MFSTSLEDPLHSYTHLSVFPRSFSDAPKSTTDVALHEDYLKSIALRSPSRYLEQAKAILDKCPELMDSSTSVLEENNEDHTGIEENRQERRPGLGRKRAKFTFKLKESDTTVNLKPTLDFSKLKDPEDFFLAYSAIENDKKNKKNESGISEGLGIDPDNLSMPSRPRRRGLLGRKATYKHRYPSMVSDDTFPLSQEIPEESSQRIPKDTEHGENEDPNIVVQDEELDGSIAEKEDKVNDLLDELLSGQFSDPDDDGQLKSLQERLRYNPLQKLSLPDIPDIPTYDLDVFGGNLPMSRNSISDRDMNVKGPSSKKPSRGGRDTEISSKLISSPTPPKSPFASVSFLQKQILQLSSLQDHDPFSPRHIDLSPTKSHSPVKNLDKQTDRVDQPRDVGGELESLVRDEDIIEPSNLCSSDGRVKDGPQSFDQIMDNATTLSKDMSLEKIHSSVEELHKQYNRLENQGELSGKSKLLARAKNNVTTSSSGSPNVAMEDSSCLVDKFLDDNTSTHDDGSNDNSVGSLDTLEENIAGNENAERTRADNQSEHHVETDNPIVFKETFASAQSDANMDIPDISGQSTSLTTSSMALIHRKEPQTRVDQQEQQIEQNNQPRRSSKRLGKRSRKDTSEGEVVQGKKESSKAVQQGEVHKKKSRSMRQSLAGAGTFIESGVRRSSRIKSKPLEYWRGERFIYARVHQSLPTIIGMKYFSPGKNVGKQTDISLKAFVSDEYKELLERAARH